MVFDIETDGLDPTKIHCLSFETDEGVRSVTDYSEMKEVLSGASSLVGHNIYRYDLPVLRKLIGFVPSKKQKVIDTLPMSWYIFPNRAKHGLAHWGEDLGIAKPTVDDWENLSVEEYIHRCEEDVKINIRLMDRLMYAFKLLYKNSEDLDKCINYLMFKMQCAADQEQIGWRIDIDKAKTHLAQLEKLKAVKIEQLTKAMPEQKIWVTRNRPKVWHKKDGSLSSHAEKWVELTEGMGLSPNYQTVRVVTDTVPANPNSITQVKEWLYSLGWSPKTFEYHRDKATGEERAVEQIRSEGELCESVTDLIEREPAVELLEGLTIINHRLGIFKSFVDSECAGYVRATVSGFTNTLRFRHAKPLVNLPSVDKPWGKEIRGCLIAPNGYRLCGADMVSLEDTTKRHYMQPHDPEYVKEMSQEGFDPHLNLAVFSGAITQAEYNFYSWFEREYG